VSYQLRACAVTRNCPGKGLGGGPRQEDSESFWDFRLTVLRPCSRSRAMETTARRKPGPPTDRLWDLDDLGAFLGCADATVTVQMTDFPPALHLKGVRGPRWLASSVQRWFEDAAAQSSMSPQKPRPRRRATGNPVPPLSQADLAEIAKVK